MKAITLKIDTYAKSFAIRMAISHRIETLSTMITEFSGLSDEVKQIFREDRRELLAIQKQLEDNI
jgi:hypothetical protein